MPILVNLTNYHQKVINILSKETSKDRPISKKALESRIKFSSELSRALHRLTLKKVVHDLRMHKLPICQSAKGYFYAHEETELEEFIKKFKAKIRKDQHELQGLIDSKENIHLEEFTFMKDLVVRTGPNSVEIRPFEIGDDGKPIIPAGVEIVQ